MFYIIIYTTYTTTKPEVKKYFFFITTLYLICMYSQNPDCLYLLMCKSETWRHLAVDLILADYQARKEMDTQRHTNFSGKLGTESIIIYKFSSKKKSSYSISVNSSPGRRKSEWQSGSPESTNRSLQSVRYRIVHEFLNIELLEHKRSGTYWFVDFRLAGWQRWECWGPDATPYRWF